MNDLKQRPLLILDFGSQYTQLIARRVREMGVYCLIYPYTMDEAQFEKILVALFYLVVLRR